MLADLLCMDGRRDHLYFSGGPLKARFVFSHSFPRLSLRFRGLSCFLVVFFLCLIFFVKIFSNFFYGQYKSMFICFYARQLILADLIFYVQAVMAICIIQMLLFSGFLNFLREIREIIFECFI